MTETQASICEWADATFGVPETLVSIVDRAASEADELRATLDGSKLIEEAADVVIVCARLGRALNVDVLSRTMADPGFTWTAQIDWAMDHLRRRVITESAWADVYLCTVVRMMHAVARDNGGDLFSAIDAKMRINRARKWRLDGSGHGQHVEGT